MTLIKQQVNLEPEVKCAFLISVKRKKVWNAELELLNKLDEICQRHGFRYWLDSGTLLGAVRHQGFIPWDDDLDVAMPRPDYDRLVAMSSNEFLDPFVFQIIANDPHYPGIHAKIRLSGTTAILKSWLFTDINQGIFIDIFPLDGVPADQGECKRFFDDNAFLGRAIKSYYTYDHILSLNLRTIRMLRQRRKTAKRFIGSVKDYAIAFKAFEDNFRKHPYDECQKVGSLLIGLPDRRMFIFERSWYDRTAYLTFEGREYPCPAEYGKALEVLIGPDYMTPKQYPSDHGAVYFDPDRDYREYLPRLRADYSLPKRLFRAASSKFGSDGLSPLERELYTL